MLPMGFPAWSSSALAALVGAAALLTGCASREVRADDSSHACMARVRSELPEGIPDGRAHCLAAGGIARRCSVLEADIAGVGKEMQDLFTGGDASWDDWKADRAGIRCAQQVEDGAALDQCCAAAGY